MVLYRVLLYFSHKKKWLLAISGVGVRILTFFTKMGIGSIFACSTLKIINDMLYALILLKKKLFFIIWERYF